MFDAATRQQQQEHLPENLIDDDIDHHFHLTEDQRPMRRDDRIFRFTDAAFDE